MYNNIYKYFLAKEVGNNSSQTLPCVESSQIKYYTIISLFQSTQGKVCEELFPTSFAKTYLYTIDHYLDVI